jgi:hypothetical protein
MGTSFTAPVGHTSMQSPQAVQSESMTDGFFAAGTRARSGHVEMQAPHAVQRSSTATVAHGLRAQIIACNREG